MTDKCDVCRGPILEGEPFYLACDPADLRRWHEDCVPPDDVEADSVFRVE